MDKTLFELSVDTQELIRALEGVAIDDVITYRDLSDRISRNVQTDAYSNLTTAVAHLRRQGTVFKAIRGVGLKHLSKPEVVRGVLPEVRKKVANIASRATKTLTTVDKDDYGQLSRDDQTTYNTSMAYVGVIKEITKPKRIAKVEKAAAESKDGALPVMKSLQEMMKG